jgi:hypothetical protein
MKTVSSIPVPATMRELTNYQAKDATSTSRWSASIQLQPPGNNLPTVKPRMPQVHQDSQLHFNSSHHEATYLLSNPGCHKHIKTVSFILATVTIMMRELTACQAKHATSTHPDSQLHFTSHNHTSTYLLSNQESHNYKQNSTDFVNLNRSCCTVSVLCSLSHLCTTHYLWINNLPSYQEHQCLLFLKMDAITHH